MIGRIRNNGSVARMIISTMRAAGNCFRRCSAGRRVLPKNANVSRTMATMSRQ